MNRYDLVLLGLILEKERSGYDIITEISNRELDRWANLSTSTVYNRLTTLEKNECIVGRAERDGNRPERMVFNITEKGREVLRKEVLKHLTGFNDDPRTLGFAHPILSNRENMDIISDVLHKTVIDLDESGTKAAAVTAVIMAGTAAPGEHQPTYITIRLDRPFVYMIVDTETGTPVFPGAMESFSR